jgi:myo-inositol-1(or 4)-monophosphatase
LNQQRLRVSETERLSEGLLATGFPSRKRHESPNFRYYTRFSLLSHGVRRDGSAALDLCYVACGRFDGFWELNLKPWDVAAGALIVREAGGMVTDFSALPYRLGGNEVLASNGRIHTELRQVFLEFAEQDAPRIPS